MRSLFEIVTTTDINNPFRRDSARAIIIKDNLLAMVYSKAYNYYKFPGGGIEENETKEEALIRETLEEAGLSIKNDSIKEYGMVYRQDEGINETTFIQNNYYYFCDVEDKITKQDLDLYEKEEGFTLVYARPMEVIKTNLANNHGPKNMNMLKREALVVEMLIKEGYLKSF